MLSHLRIAAPAELAGRLVDLLVADDRVAGVMRLPGASVEPPGDVIEADVAREATSALVQDLERAGLSADCDGLLFVSDSGRTPSRHSARAEQAAPGNPDDAVVWDSVRDDALDATAPSMSYYLLMILAASLAALAIITDSSVLVVGAMVVGPEFSCVAAICVGLVLRESRLALGALRQLVFGILTATLVVAVLFWALHVIGWLPTDLVTGPRPQTNFIWHPSWWGFLVALIAGAAGVLAMTVNRSNAMVGVFISVTTIPAVGDFALGLAVWHPSQLAGSAAQLGINLLGMMIAGTVTVGAQRLAWNRLAARRWYGRRRRSTRKHGSTT